MDKKTLIKMLEYSSESYNNMQSELDGVFLYIINDKKTDVQCYIRIHSKNLYIVFRGTDSYKDWLTDLQFWKKTLPYGNKSSKIRVHSGFINAYRSKEVRGKIHNFVTGEINKIIVAGHSYGAALATLCALDLQYNFPKKDYEVFLFGSPRVGNKAFRDSYNKRLFKTFRVSNGNDIITKIPLAIMGYRHVGINLHIGFFRIPGLFSFSQHNLCKYYSSLLKNNRPCF